MKTKLTKMTLYIINFDGNIDEEHPKQYWHWLIDDGLNSGVLNNGIHIEDLNITEIEWHDDIDINKLDAKKETYDKYFE